MLWESFFAIRKMRILNELNDTCSSLYHWLLTFYSWLMYLGCSNTCLISMSTLELASPMESCSPMRILHFLSLVCLQLLMWSFTKPTCVLNSMKTQKIQRTGKSSYSYVNKWVRVSVLLWLLCTCQLSTDTGALHSFFWLQMCTHAYERWEGVKRA